MFCLRYETWKKDITRATSNQPLMLQFADPKADKYHPSHARQKELVNAIVDDLVLEGCLPISLVQQTWFASFMKVIDPKFIMPSRYKIESTIDVRYKMKREVVRQKLFSANAVSLTLDMWSDRRMRSYLGVTVYLLTADMQFEGFLLDFVAASGSHTGENVANHCISIVDEFEIRSTVCFVVTDNASNMLKAFKSMSDIFKDDESSEGVEFEEEAIAVTQACPLPTLPEPLMLLTHLVQAMLNNHLAMSVMLVMKLTRWC